MFASEMESKLMNFIQDSSGSNKLINKLQNGGLVIKNVKEARGII